MLASIEEVLEAVDAHCEFADKRLRRGFVRTLEHVLQGLLPGLRALSNLRQASHNARGSRSFLDRLGPGHIHADKRSALAAKEIMELIGASIDKVETGTRLVRTAGATISEVVASADKVSKAAARRQA